MSYECEPKLQSPLPLDCEKFEYSGLGAPTEKMTVGPEAPHLFSLGTCSLAISATVQLVLTWQQVKAALGSLILECITHPLHHPMGSTAHFNIPGSSTSILSRSVPHSALNGLNALPPHANITLFR